jgi:hypothetical protein
MNPLHNLPAILLFSLVVLLAGCAAAPVQEMSNARQAVEAARQVGAASLAPLEMKTAEALLVQAEKSLAEKRYREAREQAKAAREQAVLAQKKALNQ